MSQSSDKLPNLGKYSMRLEEPSNDLQVGSFYKNQRLEISDNETIKQQYSSKDTLSTEKLDKSSDNDSRAQKRPLVEESGNKPINKDAKIRALEERFNTKKISSRVKDEKLSNSKKTHSQDSNKPETHPIPDPIRYPKDDEDTHESVVIDLNPAVLVDGASDESSGQGNSKNMSQPESFILYTPKLPKQMRKKTYPKRMPYDKILSDVTFVLSGYENPLRSRLRDMALEMGATYKPNWCRSCTHLICAFKNTPKYKEVMADHGRIVSERWIQECSNQRRLLDWRKFKLGDYHYPDSEEECEIDGDLDYALRTSYTEK